MYEYIVKYIYIMSKTGKNMKTTANDIQIA